jgi:hypothetical protein
MEGSDNLEKVETVNNKDLVDDTYILPKDKKELVKVIRSIYENMYPWSDETLMKCLILEHYRDVVSKMDKEAYLKEIECNNIEDLI